MIQNTTNNVYFYLRRKWPQKAAVYVNGGKKQTLRSHGGQIVKNSFVLHEVNIIKSKEQQKTMRPFHMKITVNYLPLYSVSNSLEKNKKRNSYTTVAHMIALFVKKAFQNHAKYVMTLLTLMKLFKMSKHRLFMNMFGKTYMPFIKHA